MNLYTEWGFKESPFKTTSLEPNGTGKALLIGRESEITSISRRIFNPPKMVTVEGLNGVGKTSLVNVAAFMSYEDHINTGRGSLYIPCNKVFQITNDVDIDDFIDDVLMAVAQTLLERADELKLRDYPFNTDSINRWLNSPQLESYSGGVWIFSAGKNTETNTSRGYEKSGFRKEILLWLESLFPTIEDGGVICMIDNLELLQSSENARHKLETLRDVLFNIRGLRWVLCGALGIVLGVASSPRLEGYLHTPVVVNSLENQFASEVLITRINAFAEGRDYYLPFNASEFEFLFNLLKGNLRSVLSYIDDYCNWVADNTEPETEEEKRTFFNGWLNSRAEEAYEAFRKQIRPRALEVFNTAIQIGGLFAPSDYELFRFRSIPAMRPHIRDLEEVGVLVSTQDDGDKRRKTIQITPKGLLIHYYLHLQNA
ncbi:MarR family transcriptional regulator [Paenibacillus dendritiformis]|uniref:MarR family transcriptional regulator n=1 Tax=Paenibacillus dendritiformis TaxID=130049 RepID=UPI00105A1E9E|nr:MarR family transcriptional regulator [Paenibacillus dendritiformis]TDL57180.1 MarR family transcriptional regulator [Paenibacillus dendritiformis]